eukprot:CAMPEP_0178689216 /NCGR_PEP_ID=MMETSP0699-20121125/5418_1 /TAXON_ID=265572 /ORGANISM="Extubocellulus spinifer, Strain CCMP396" /LENGTH=557 /DNA_ID=CAMNT_0020334261 /DNA_START=167 /DNA_END=1841 /DNA_ORIENTATION=+
MATICTSAVSPSVLISKVTSGFASLRGSPSELWKAYVLKFLDSYAYFSFSIIFTLFLSSDFGYSDVTAGTIYGAWGGALITIYGLVAGFIVDNIGVASSLRLGFALSLIARILIFATRRRSILLLNICLTLPLGNCLGIPVLTTGIRRYTNEASRGFAFGLFYVVMNVSALISGPVVDMLTILYKGETSSEKAIDETDDTINSASGNTAFANEWSLSSYRAIILTGVVANIIACFITLTVREIKVDSKETVQMIPVPRSASASSHGSNMPLEEVMDELELEPCSDSQNVSTFKPAGGSALEILRETLSTKSFWRFLVVCLITLNVRMIFRHLDATLPKYMMREFGPDVAKGTIYAINPALIIILVPLVTAATTTVEPLVMIHYGAYVSALSVFFLVMSTSIWACVLFVSVLSVGEAIWSPRLYDYTMSMCREGREGTYMALSSAPLFLAKLPVGFMSGYLLQKYCPEDGERHSQTMWLIIGLTTALSPILLTVFWGYISKKDEDDEKYMELRDVNAKEGDANEGSGLVRRPSELLADANEVGGLGRRTAAGGLRSIA